MAVQVYWLHMDYLQVAAAALRCGAPFTALLYVEHWCEERLRACTMEGIDTSTQVRWRCQVKWRFDADKIMQHLFCLWIQDFCNDEGVLPNPVLRHMMPSRACPTS